MSRHPWSAKERSPARSRAFLLPMVAVLAAISGLALVRASMLIAAPPALATQDEEANHRLVHRFYAAVNEAVRTGDPSSLDAVVALSVATGPKDAAAGRGGIPLDRRLAALHAIAPDLRLAPDEILADGDQVFARVSSEGGPAWSFLGDPPTGSLAPWGAADWFRIEGGRIAEHRSVGPALALQEPLLRTAVAEVPPVPHHVGLARLSFAPASRVPELVSPGPVLLLVMEGTLGVELGRTRETAAGNVALLGAPGATASGGLVSLEVGERMMIPGGTPYALRNDRTSPAVALAAAVLAREEEGNKPERRGFTLPLDVALFITGSPPPDSALVSTEPPWPRGVGAASLAGSLDTALPQGPASVTVARLTLAPGTTLPLPPTAAPTLVAVEAGAADVTVGHGEARVRAAATAPWTLLTPEQGQPNPTASLRATGSVVFAPGSSGMLRPHGPVPLVVLTITLVQDEGSAAKMA